MAPLPEDFREVLEALKLPVPREEAAPPGTE